MSSGKVLLGVLAGVAAGALLGVLFAPDKGWNTRKRIAKKADDYIDGLREKFEELLDTVSEKMEDVKDQVSEFVEQEVPKGAKAGKEVKTSAG
jgi:gas vesicle protein